MLNLCPTSGVKQSQQHFCTQILRKFILLRKKIQINVCFFKVIRTTFVATLSDLSFQQVLRASIRVCFQLSTSLPIFNNCANHNSTLKALKQQRGSFSAEAGTVVRKGKRAGERGSNRKKETQRGTIAKDQVRRWSYWSCHPVNWLIPMSE